MIITSLEATAIAELVTANKRLEAEIAELKARVCDTCGHRIRWTDDDLVIHDHHCEVWGRDVDDDETWSMQTDGCTAWEKK